jgi:integrase
MARQHKQRKHGKGKTILRLPDLEQSRSAVLNSLAAASSQESYGLAIDEFTGWYCSEPRLAFNRTVVLRYRFFLEQKRLAPSTINVRLAAVRRLAYEAADAGLLSPELAAGIRRVKGAKRLGTRVGNWLTLDQARALVQHKDDDLDSRSKRDRAIIALLLGCGLRRAELVGLRIEDFQLREDHWIIADLVGKAKHVRTVPVPNWVRSAVDDWTSGGISTGYVFRKVMRTDKIWGERLSAKAIWHVVKRRSAPASIGLHPMISGARARGSATWREESWSRSSSCLAMCRFRLRRRISAASRSSGTPSMTSSDLKTCDTRSS